MLLPFLVTLSTVSRSPELAKGKGLSRRAEMLRGVYPERSEGLSMTVLYLSGL